MDPPLQNPLCWSLWFRYRHPVPVSHCSSWCACSLYLGNWKSNSIAGLMWDITQCTSTLVYSIPVVYTVVNLYEYWRHNSGLSIEHSALACGPCDSIKIPILNPGGKIMVQSKDVANLQKKYRAFQNPWWALIKKRLSFLLERPHVRMSVPSLIGIPRPCQLALWNRHRLQCLRTCCRWSAAWQCHCRLATSLRCWTETGYTIKCCTTHYCINSNLFGLSVTPCILWRRQASYRSHKFQELQRPITTSITRGFATVYCRFCINECLLKGTCVT